MLFDPFAAPSTPYCGAAPVPAVIWSQWNLDPSLLAALALLLGVGLIWAERRGPLLWAVALLVVAFVSPLCSLTSALFAARALHHLLLVTVIAPLLALALPLRAAVPASLGFGLTALALVLWHLPPVYAAAWNSVAIYWLLQLALLLPAWAFWSALWLRPSPSPSPAQGQRLVDAGYIAALAAVMGLIGAVLTFASAVLYPEHLSGTMAWGLTPLQDQQAAGLIMWVPGLLPLALLAAWTASRFWLQERRI